MTSPQKPTPTLNTTGDVQASKSTRPLLAWAAATLCVVTLAIVVGSMLLETSESDVEPEQPPTPKLLVSGGFGTTGWGRSVGRGGRKSDLLTVTASVGMKDMDGVHNGNNFIDGDRRTAWCTSTPGDGIGDWIEVSYDCSAGSGRIAGGIGMVNGYAMSEESYGARNSVRTANVLLTVTNDDGSRDMLWDGTFSFFKKIGEQRFALKELDCGSKGQILNIRFTIEEIYKGHSSAGTCMSEFSLYELR